MEVFLTQSSPSFLFFIIEVKIEELLIVTLELEMLEKKLISYFIILSGTSNEKIE